jgi:magnesium-transporting ATPase (P-type)
LSNHYAQTKFIHYSAEDLEGGMENAYTKTPAEALKHFQVTEEKGLSEQQVKELRAKHGKNCMLAHAMQKPEITG